MYRNTTSTDLLSVYREWKGVAWEGRTADMVRSLDRWQAFAASRGVNDYLGATQADAFAWARQLAAETNALGAVRSYSDQARQLAHVSACYNAALRRGVIASNPFAGVGTATARPAAPNPGASIYTREQLAQLYRTAIAIKWGGKRHWQARMLLLALMHSMARPSEILALRRQDVAMVDGVCVIHLCRGGDGKTINASRRVPMPHFPQFATFAEHSATEELFAAIPSYGRDRSHWLSLNWRRLADAAGLPGDAYWLRHTGICMLAASPVPERLQDVLSGHSPRDVKARHYVAFDLAAMVDAMRYVDPGV